MAEKETVLKRRGISGLSPDVQAMAAIDKAMDESLNGLADDDLRRVMEWMHSKYFPTKEATNAQTA